MKLSVKLLWSKLSSFKCVAWVNGYINVSTLKSSKSQLLRSKYWRDFAILKLFSKVLTDFVSNICPRSETLSMVGMLNTLEIMSDNFSDAKLFPPIWNHSKALLPSINNSSFSNISMLLSDPRDSWFSLISIIFLHLHNDSISVIAFVWLRWLFETSIDWRYLRLEIACNTTPVRLLIVSFLLWFSKISFITKTDKQLLFMPIFEFDYYEKVWWTSVLENTLKNYKRLTVILTLIAKNKINIYHLRRRFAKIWVKACQCIVTKIQSWDIQSLYITIVVGQHIH